MDATRDAQLKKIQAVIQLDEARDMEDQASFIAFHGDRKTAEDLLHKASMLRQQAKQLVIMFLPIF